MFNKPRELTVFEISELVSAFGHAAGKLKAAGFTGVQIHGAHGYLVSQFLSPLHNQRTDEYGGSLENRMNFVCDIYDSIRSEVGANFPIGIKLNSADFQKGGFSQEDSVKVVEKLSDMGIDLIEVSGGTYESPEMMTGSIKESTQKREAYFQDYCKLIRHIKAPILLTGGFRTSSGMNNALESKACDFIGLARSIAIDPDFANKVLSEAEVSSPVKPLKSGSKFIDKLIPLEIVWYTEQIHRLGKNKLTSENMSVKWVALKTFFSLGKNIFKKVRV